MSATKSRHKNLNLRATLIELLVKVQNGQSLAQLQQPYLQKVAAQDKALFHEISLGTLRQWFVLKQLVLPLLEQQQAPEQAAVEVALYVGLYQLLFTRIPDHAAISETVTAIKQLGFETAAPLVNAVLRRATREVDSLLAQTEQAHGLPSWLFKRLKKDWGEQALPLAQILRQVAPIFLRVNVRLISREDYLRHLQQQDIAAQAVGEHGIQLLQAVTVPDLPGFVEGWFSVQDLNAQISQTLLPNLDDLTVLDACAAPGGKAAHLLEHYQPKSLIALDNDENRMQRVYDNLSRLQVLEDSVQLIIGDATRWQARQPLDFILLDAPCSATGVLRRHPDIRLLRQSTDIEQTVALQSEILENLWAQLKVGGYLLYITCSILKVENEQQIADFVARHDDAEALSVAIEGAIAQSYGQQLLPTPNGGDGFYYCLLKKR